MNEQQIEVNTAASNIDIALTKRRDTLIKLLEQQKAYYKYEGNTQTNIAKLRSMDIKNFSEAKQVMDNVENEIKMTFENYPDLKANQLAQDLMGTSELLESEIAASRRVYNMKVETFNSVIYTFPTNCIAKSMGLKNFALFQATSEQKQDVDMSSLSDYDSNSSNPSNDQNNDNKLTNNY
ncbi:LemA family protein [bacterium]|nr:LemA family protein [bacterium]